MSAWKAGDKGVCIRSSPWHDADDVEVDGPVKDVVYLVDAVHEHPDHGVYLALAGWHGWWDCEEFRKIVPRSQRVNEEIEAVA